MVIFSHMIIVCLVFYGNFWPLGVSVFEQNIQINGQELGRLALSLVQALAVSPVDM